MTSSTPQVLICDDNESIIEGLRLILESEGYKVSSTSSFQAALNITQKHTFDLVLVDLHWPGHDGRELVDHVAHHSPHSTVVVISAEESMEVAVDAVRRGAYDFIRKPYSPPEMLQRIQNALEVHKLKIEQAHSRQRVHNSELLHRFLVENSPDLIYVLDEKGLFVLVNEQFAAVLGYEVSSLVGRDYRTLVHFEDQPQLENEMRLLDKNQDTIRKFELRLKRNSSDNTYLVFETKLMGVEHLQNPHNQLHYSDTGLSNMSKYGIARDITERKQAEDLITFQATHDQLTRLPNRVMFENKLVAAIELAKRENYLVGVMFIDLDRFKVINDSLGHIVGDKLLQHISAGIKDVLRDSDTLARLGGDEFILLLPKVEGRAAVEHVAGKVLKVLRSPIDIDGHEINMSGSLGIALFPEHGNQAARLIHNADLAMYQIKNQSRDGFAFFDPSLDQEVNRRYELERDLRAALAEEQLRVFYQPQIDITLGRVTCMEALVRWRHPRMGLLSPGDFIELAEETRLINQLGSWVLDAACSDMSDWVNHGAQDVRVAVNFSACQFEGEGVVALVRETLKKHGLSGRHLEVEITESVLLRDFDSVTEQLRQLSDMGVLIALDDFGTGYTSLNYLKNLPVDTLKIDRSFIQGLGETPVESSIVTAILGMAQGLNMRAIQEGVETTSQMAYLKSAGCTEMQGYYFAQPQPADHAADCLEPGRYGGLC